MGAGLTSGPRIRAARLWQTRLSWQCLTLLPVSSEDHMYLKINKFLLSHEHLNMNKVPGFYQFFYSSDFQVSPQPRAPETSCALGHCPSALGRQWHVGAAAWRRGVGNAASESWGAGRHPRRVPSPSSGFPSPEHPPVELCGVRVPVPVRLLHELPGKGRLCLPQHLPEFSSGLTQFTELHSVLAVTWPFIPDLKPRGKQQWGCSVTGRKGGQGSRAVGMAATCEWWCHHRGKSRQSVPFAWVAAQHRAEVAVRAPAAGDPRQALLRTLRTARGFPRPPGLLP